MIFLKSEMDSIKLLHQGQIRHIRDIVVSR